MKSSDNQKPYVLTKSRVISGLQCHKKLWLDINSPIKKDLHIFHIGNRFGEFARTHYGSGVDLTGNLDALDAIDVTQKVLNDPQVPVIYEAAFLHNDTLVRVDVLRRHPSGWEMIEVKSSTKLKDEHIHDASVQAYIVTSCGVELIKVQIAHINNETFIYAGDGNYSKLIVEADITSEVSKQLPNVAAWVSELKPIVTAKAPMPEVDMGSQCTSPYDCPHQARCGESTPKLADIPISILPNSGKSLAQAWAKKDIYDLKDLPEEALSNPKHKIIQEVHRSGKNWISSKTRDQINQLGWPRYFMDFETAQQGVPLMAGTKAYDALPFQWSVHRWDSNDQNLNVDDGMGYLNFYSPHMDREFLETLLAALGTSGPIFSHHASFECRILNELIKRPSCNDLTPSVEALIKRVIDTEDIAKEGFYAPEMMGSNSLKMIVKAIPTTVDYNSSESLSGGGDAQIAWFKCTDPGTSTAEKLEWEKKLKHYCAQDTLAMYDFVKYIAQS